MSPGDTDATVPPAWCPPTYLFLVTPKHVDLAHPPVGFVALDQLQSFGFSGQCRSGFWLKETNLSDPARPAFVEQYHTSAIPAERSWEIGLCVCGGAAEASQPLIGAGEVM